MKFNEFKLDENPLAIARGAATGIAKVGQAAGNLANKAKGAAVSGANAVGGAVKNTCLLYTSPSPRD